MLFVSRDYHVNYNITFKRTYFSLVLFVQDSTKRTKEKYAAELNVRTAISSAEHQV